MKEKYKKILTLKRPELVDEIDPEGGLINHLESKKILTRRQAVTICRQPDPFRKNEALLDILYKRPDEDFEKFCDALTECNQEHVVCKYLAIDIPSSVLYSRDTAGDVEGLGIDIRREGPSVSRIVESFQNGSLNVRDQASGARPQTVPSASPPGDKKPLMDSPKLIPLEDIIVRRCADDFYRSKEQTAYKMNKVCRGKCLIINISETFRQEPRQGAEVDERIVQKLFQELHFDVVLCKNLSAEDIRRRLADVLRDPHLVDDQCFVLFLMSHGAIEKYGGVQSEVIFGSDGKLVATSEILEQIANCQALAGKPKLAFFQACRGDYYDQSDCKPENQPVEEDKEVDVTETDANPPGVVNLQDFIVGFPTQSGFRSFRNTKNGSWYLNAIVRVFMEDSHHMDVSAMLRKVNGIVSKWLPNTADTAMMLKGQMASLTDGLVKPYLYLFPGIIRERSSS